MHTYTYIKIKVANGGKIKILKNSKILFHNKSDVHFKKHNSYTVYFFVKKKSSWGQKKFDTLSILSTKKG